ncbi:MAG: cupin domain-containing protein [Oscillospiraceae bacterium]|nr:cupin domain-containing protein [Oscillospiraceae bacterium]
MQITDITISPSTGQELLPGFSEDFPCIRSEVVFGKYNGGHAPWHWHKAVELFYIAEGELEYHTPGGRILFQEGSGGFVNSGVLHMTRPNLKKGETRQLLHLFDPYFICDSSGGILARKYIFPVVSSGVEFLTFSRNDPAEADLLSLLEFSFSLEEGIFGYEFKLRSLISEMWLKILEKMPQPEKRADVSHVDDKLKRMMMFVHEHYGENIRTVDLQVLHLQVRENATVFFMIPFTAHRRNT